MRASSACLAALGLAAAATIAQAAGDPVDKLRACAALAAAERTECLDKLAREITPSSDRPTPGSTAAASPAVDKWVVSETTSPLDYSPVVVASAVAATNLKLSIACRSGGTSLAVEAPDLAPGKEATAASYVVNGAPPVVMTGKPAASGAGIVVATDVVRLLSSLPAQGEIAFRITGRQGADVEGRYSLAGLKAVRERLAVACKWT